VKSSKYTVSTPTGSTIAQAHISVRVNPSSGAPPGWKSVARVKSVQGM
jgi:hypothetical protein